MAYEVGDAGHIGVHGDLVSRLTALGTTWAVTLTLPDAPNLGDSGHVADHNLVAQAVREVHAAQVLAGALVDPLPPLPDDAVESDLGHVDDHNLIEAALEVVEAGRFPYNSATGGTVTEIADYLGTGQSWRVHTFTTSGDTFTVTEAVKPFRVLVVGGGGGGGAYDGNWHGCGGSGGFDTQDDTATIPLGDHLVTIGGGGGWGGEGTWSYGGAGGESRLGDLFTAAGGAGGDPPGVNNGNYYGGASNGGNSDITGTMTGYGYGGAPDSGAVPAANSGGGGGGGHTGRGDPGGPRAGSNGAAGIVVVAYEIATIGADYVEDVGGLLPILPEVEPHG